MRWRYMLAVAAVLVAVAAGLGFWSFHQTPPALTLPGIVETQQVRLSSKVGGRIARVVVAEGDVVEPGQPMVYLDLPELHAQKEQTQARARAAYADLERARNGARPEEKAAAKAAYEAATASYQRIKAGARPQELDQARAELGSAGAERTRSEQELERVAALYRRQAAPRADYDAAVATQKRLEQEVQRLQARLDLLVAGSRVEEIAEAAAKMEQARANYELLLAGSRAEDVAACQARYDELEARLAEIEINLAEAVVRAPEKAVVEVLPVRKGDVVSPNQPVARVLRAEDLWVKVFVPETELGKVRMNQAVTVTVDSYPNRRFNGSVVQIASISEFTPRNVQSASERRHQMFAVKVRIADPQGVFKSGMAADVRVPLRGVDE